MNIKSICILLFLGLNSPQIFAQLYINEWMASNSSVISDPDFDDTGDWIELFNDNNDPIDVSGYYLTDNFGEPTKWSFPDSSIIEAKSFLLIWADGRNTGNHAAFKLTKIGEEIGLYDADTTLIDHITYSHQKTNVSMGRRTDGSTDLAFFDEPTPGSSNLTKAYTGITFYQPKYSITGGLYSNPLTVELEAIDGEIRFTTDGSQPTLASEIYSTPIEINTTTVLRSVVFEPDHLPGKPITHTYFFEPTFAERKLPIISISSNPEFFWDDIIGLYVQDFKPAWEYPINIELFENDGSDRAALNELAGTKVNGLHSWQLPQKMLGIYFDNDYDKNNLEYPLFFDKDRTRFDNFILRASGSDWGNTLFRDALCQGLTDQNMDIEKMAFRPSIVFINGEYMGIHNMRSRIDEGFIEENFGYMSTEYDLIENNGVVEEGDNSAFYELFQMFENDLSEESNFEAVAQVMDVDNFTDYFITEIWSSNSSWGHNIQMWKPKTEGSKWRWILQDLDRGFVGADDELIHKFSTSEWPEYYNWARVPLKSMLENENYGYQFAQRFTDHLFTTFHTKTVVAAIEKHKDLIDQEIPYHVGRWAGTTSGYGNGLPSIEYWENEVTELIDFAHDRPAVLIADLQDRFNLSDAVDLTLLNTSESAGKIEINSLPIPSTPWQGQYFTDMPFQVEAKPQVNQEFLGWSTAHYEELIPKESEWKYLDDGSDQGSVWKEVDFNDSAWSSGNAKFGYGDNNENTTISFGGDPNNKFITTYFRKEFTIENINTFAGTLSIELLRDDAAVVYINGKEYLRSNLPQGDINNSTLGSTFVGEEAETTFYNFLVERVDLVEGTNTIAVEIHQSEANSSDLGFDLSLKALMVSNSNYISTEPILDITLDSDSILVANYQSLNLCTLPERIITNTTLDLSCSPYFATSDVVVDSTVTLTIEEGVEIYFPEGRNFEINGNLMINGSEDLPVFISAIDEDQPWGGLIFKNTTSLSSLHHLEISRASNGHHPIYENAAISGFYSAIEMDHITIIDVESNPILTYYSDVVLSNSNLHSKVTGDLINVKYGKGEVTNTIFRGNDQIDTDAIDFDGVMDGKISGNKISGFLGFNSDGIDIGEETENVLIEGNFIHDCTDKGISVGQSSFIEAFHNVIINCDIGVAVKDQSGAFVDQNTFYNVGVPVSCFEKNVGLGGGNSLITNSILSNSSKAPFRHDSISQIVIITSLSDTDSLPALVNFFGNPLFTSPSFNDFSLQSGSVAIENGIDGNGMVVNIGAKENPYMESPSLMISAIEYFPKENPDAEFLTIYNASNKSVDMSGYLLADAVDFTFPNGSIIKPNETILVALDKTLIAQDIDQQFSWTRGRLSNEGEKISLIAPSGIVVDHVRYDNKAPWPIEAAGSGKHLQLVDPGLDNHFPESWKAKLSTSTDNPYSSPLEVKVYPNPARDFITIESNEDLIQSLEIINAVGQTVHSSVNGSNVLKTNIQNLKAGVYFLRVNEIMQSGPLIIH